MTVGQPPRIQLAAHEHGRSQTAEALHPPPGPIIPGPGGGTLQLHLVTGIRSPGYNVALAPRSARKLLGA
jgi:hypothetical protein